MKFVDIKNDIAFRKIFGNENKKEILISFLNAVLDFTGDKKIKTVTILNPFQLPELIKYKTTVIDIKATDQSDHFYIIEMQVADKGNFDKRIQYYSSKAYNAQIIKGEDYHLLKPTIFIGILNFNFLESITYLTKHIICNPETKEQVLKDLEFNFIELLKFKTKIEDCKTLVDKWIYFIKNAEDLTVVPNNLDDNGLSEAYNDANQMSWTPQELELYDYAKMRERDEFEELEKAIENAIIKKEKETVKKLYQKSISLSDIAEITDLPLEQIKEILQIAD